jgi:mannosyltransferase OCH1-like enzyme
LESLSPVPERKQALADLIFIQTWKTRDLPFYFHIFASTWRERNPHFRYLLTDDISNRDFFALSFPPLLTLYDSFPKEIYRVDFFRYAYLLHRPALYADLDFICLQPFQPLLEMYRNHNVGVILGRMGQDTHFPHSIPNALMISLVANHLFWWFVLHEIMERSQKRRHWGSVESTTGPVVLHTAYQRWKQWNHSMIPPCQNLMDRFRLHWYDMVRTQVIVLDSSFFYPIDWHLPVHQEKYRKPFIRKMYQSPEQLVNLLAKTFPTSLAVTIWTHTWD